VPLVPLAVLGNGGFQIARFCDGDEWKIEEDGGMEMHLIETLLNQPFGGIKDEMKMSHVDARKEKAGAL
jgi:hypothetical protein